MKGFILFSLIIFSLSASYDALASCGAATCPLNNHRYLQVGCS